MTKEEINEKATQLGIALVDTVSGFDFGTEDLNERMMVIYNANLRFAASFAAGLVTEEEFVRHLVESYREAKK
jgi:hypothetical protein